MRQSEAKSIPPPVSLYSRRSVLVLGGAGFIGSALARRLDGLGACVTVVDCFEEHGGAHALHLEGAGPGVKLDRRDAAASIADRDLGGIDFIFNCIGLTDHHLGFRYPELDYRINCATTLPLLQRLAETAAPARLISIGTRSQYGAGGSQLLESDRLNPLDIQAIHKTALEQYHFVYARTGRLRFAFVRLTNTYGPGQRMRGEGIGFVGELIRAALDGRAVEIYGHLDRVKDLLYVDDAVDGLLRVGLLADEPDPVYNLGGQPCRIGDLVDILALCVASDDAKLEVRVTPFPEEVRRLDTGDAALNTDKLARATGWVPKTSLARGMTTTVDYYRRHRARYW